MSDHYSENNDSNVHSRQVYGLTVLKNSHKDIRRLRRQTGNTSLHGNKLWNSSCLLIDYLSCYPPDNGLRIIDIGCGWGISSIYCAKSFQADVTALDADERVFPYCHHHAAINKVTLTTRHSSFESLKIEDLANYDMVIASDICFWDELAEPLSALIYRCYEAGVSRVVIADPGREPFQWVAEHAVELFSASYEPWSAPHPYNMSGFVLDIA